MYMDNFVTLIQECFSTESERYLKELTEFLGFQSISVDPSKERDCITCASWVMSQLAHIGFKVSLLATDSLPCVYGTIEGNLPGPTVLYYGHYDVLSAGDLSAWRSDPFRPEVRDGRIYGRGAADDKGQILAVIRALEFLRDQGRLCGTVKVVIEGEEETGSGGLSALLENNRDLFKADVVMACDTAMSPFFEPAVVISMRGLVELIFDVVVSSRFLHSGHHGNLIMNPFRVASDIIQSFYNPDSTIAIPGYFDSTTSFHPTVVNAARQAHYSADEYLVSTGGYLIEGEAGLSCGERVAIRPSIDIHGVSGGNVGPFIKTTIPPSVRVALSSRLVVGQDPERCQRLLIDHIMKHTPYGAQTIIVDAPKPRPAVCVNPESVYVRAVRHVLEDLTSTKVVYRAQGSSLPIISQLAEVSSGTPILVGFSHEKDNVHGNNESIALERLRLCFAYACCVLSRGFA